MKVLLIQPPFTILRTESKKCHPPLGLAYLAAALKENCEVFILDALAEGYEEEEIINKSYLRYGLSFENIKKKIIAISPDIIGISCLFSAQFGNVSKLCQIVKEIDKRIITVLGGAHPSAVPEEVLEDDSIDFVVIGEGEISLKGLLECIEIKKDLQNIEGIGFKNNGSIKINRKRWYHENLDTIPLPNWNIFPLEKYFEINNPHGSPARRTPFLPVITSRGCPFKCVFCSIYNIWGRNFRVRSSENVLLELDYLVNRFGVKEILFEDDNLTLDKERAKQIFREIINKKLDLTWSTPNGIAVQTLDEEILELMKESGCYAVSIGIESGDEYVLKNIIEKPIALSRVKPVVKKAKSLGLETTAFFVVGFPGETRAQLKNTFRFAEELEADNVNFFFATPLPGTRLLKLCEERGLINDKLDYAKLKSDYPNFSTESFSTDDLMHIISRERLKVYLLYLLRNPGKFLYKIYNKLLNDPAYFVRFGIRYLRENT